ncbi:sorting nexin-18 [Bufo gargarizans]|uniref:sorting nexin-18 n=1 Tax=Bufo gargarizans TaxID=30331 RepID=UPI001CF3B65E|nr:sorting nexin-18 [Bufo gargarizans]
MAVRARALYDFRAENPGEVSLRESEVLSLCSEQDIEGWLEGVNSSGERGLFPASYVEIVRGEVAGPPPPPPPPPPPSADSRYANLPPGGYEPAVAPPSCQSFSYSGARPAALQYQHSQPSDDDWDDEWDDSSSTAADEAPAPGYYGGGFHDYDSSRYRLSTPGSYSTTTSSTTTSSQAAKGTATVGRNLNRFSAFVKSGGEAFVLGDVAGFVRDGDKLCVVQGPHGPEWQENPYPFGCTIDEPTKQTKFKGMKSYISYRLLPSHTGLQVHRRYKHFDWLYARLLVKFPVISIPRIPEKQATGRFEEDFISKRRKGLLWWMDHMCSHPVLSRCDAFQHFLTCSDEKAWKQGKRKCEKDEMVGANFFLTLSTMPGAPVLEVQEVEAKLDAFKSFAKRMDEGVLLLNQTVGEFARKQASGFKKEYQKVGMAFKGLGQAFEIDQQPFSGGLNQAMSFTADAYDAIGEMFAEQPRQDLDPIMDLLAVYQGHLANFPDIIHVQRGALAKVRESKRHIEEGKMEPQKAKEIQERCNVITYATLAEIQHFHKIRVRDFKSQMQHYLQQQIMFFQKVTLKLEEALQKYDTA